MEINENILKLTGKVSLPEPLQIGHNFKIVIEGSVTDENLHDNNNGTFDKIYRFEPVLVEAITPSGERIKAKDYRKKEKERHCFPEDQNSKDQGRIY